MCFARGFFALLRMKGYLFDHSRHRNPPPHPDRREEPVQSEAWESPCEALPIGPPSYTALIHIATRSASDANGLRLKVTDEG